MKHTTSQKKISKWPIKIKKKSQLYIRVCREMQLTRMAKKETDRSQILLRLLSNWKSHTFLMGMC